MSFLIQGITLNRIESYINRVVMLKYKACLPDRKASHYFKRKSLLAVNSSLAVCFFIPFISYAQLKWNNVDSLYAPLPPSLHIFKTTDSLDDKPFIAYYVIAKLKARDLDFTADTTFHRRFTPKQFYEKEDHPLVVVNCSFFNFDRNQNLNVVIRDGKLAAYNIHTIPMKGKDTFQYKHPLGSAIGISKRRKADIAWLYTDSSHTKAFASQSPVCPVKDSLLRTGYALFKTNARFKKWRMRTAVGGGPVLVQEGKIFITNEEELKFTGKAIRDKHPRTAMGYTKEGYLVIMVIQGRFPGIAEGATLEQEAKLLVDIGCIEALNLDGGGSSCLLINGKETIKPSDKEGERPVPAIFIIK